MNHQRLKANLMPLPVAIMFGLFVTVPVTAAYLLFKLHLPQRLDSIFAVEQDPSRTSKVEALLLEWGSRGLWLSVVFLIDLAVGYAWVAKYVAQPVEKYMLNSGIMHTLLVLLPPGLVRKKGMTLKNALKSLGFRKGDWRFQAVCFSTVVAGYALGNIVMPLWKGLALPVIREASLLGVLVSLIAVPVTEELFFRGYLQGIVFRGFGKYRGHALGEAALASSLFALIHIPKALYYEDMLILPFVLDFAIGFRLIAYVVQMFLIGVCLGLIYQRTDSLAAPIAIHSFLNFTRCIECGVI